MHARWKPLDEAAVVVAQSTAAGLGSGMTPASIQQLLSTVLDPEEVMSVTFTRVDDMREVKVLEVILTPS